MKTFFLAVTLVVLLAGAYGDNAAPGEKAPNVEVKSGDRSKSSFNGLDSFNF